MRTALDIGKLLALCAFSVFLAVLTLDAHTASKHLSALLMSATDATNTANDQLPRITNDVDAASASVSGLRADLKPILKQSALDLQEAHNLILEAGLTAMEARKASAEERAALPALTADAKASIEGLTREMDALKTFTDHADGMVTDPHIKAAIAHTDATMSHVDAITGDAAQMTHKFAHPTKMQVFEGWLETLGVIGAKALVP
jgi:hypothetical protein